MKSSPSLPLLVISALACSLLLVAGCHYCDVHGERLHPDTVPVRYGLIIPSENYREASKDFPNANTWSPGGCCSFPGAPRTEKVLYCKACRKAKAEWIESNRPGPTQ